MINALIFGLMNAALYLRYPRHIKRFRKVVGYLPNIAFPKRTNEMMLWRKIFDHNPLFAIFSDKLATKRFVADRCPGLSIANPVWTGQDCREIPTSHLQSALVVKANHGCGWNHFHHPENASLPMPCETINGWLDRTHGAPGLEWAYQQADKILFCEPLLGEAGQAVTDLAVHAGDGIIFFLEVIVANKSAYQQKAYFKADGTRFRHIERTVDADERDPYLPNDFTLHAQFQTALKHTKRLSDGVDYARFDFMIVGDFLYGGEITVYPGSGLTNHTKFKAYNAEMETCWDLSKAWRFTAPSGAVLSWYLNALQRSFKKIDS